MFEYKLKRHTKSKNVKILIDSQGKVTVTAPFFLSLKTIEKFILSQSNWIKQHKLKSTSNKKIWNELDNISLFEQKYTLRLWKLKSKPPYRLTSDSLWLKPEELDKIEFSLPKIISDNLKNQFEARIKYINKHGPQLPWKKLTIRSQKSRWGSYSSNGTLSFNWKLSLCPLNIIDYVIIHELCHIAQHNHSKKFWDLVAKYDPNYKVHKNWLKNYSQNLI